MTKRTGKTRGAQGENGGVGRLAEALTPLIARMTATRTHLLEWVHTVGIGALQAVFTRRRKPWRPQGQAPARAHASSLGPHSHGVDVRRPAHPGARPRVRSCEGRKRVAGGGGVAGAGSADGAGTRTDLLGVSTRGYADSLEAWPAARRAGDEQERGEPNAWAGA